MIKKRFQRGIYILPSLFTSANLIAGFMSMVFSIEKNFTAAAWAIIAAIIFDVFDGRVARWTNSTSDFGIEFDSMADVVSFGIAPAVMMYQMVLNSMNRVGIAIALFFVMSGALRLARFNSKAHEMDKPGDFVGLPIPASAGILASFVLSYELFEAHTEINAKTLPIIMDRMPFFFNTIPITMIIISILMVSTVPYSGFKGLKLNRPKSLQVLFFVLIGIFLILAYPQNVIFIVFLLYLLSGLTGYIWRLWRLRRPLGDKKIFGRRNRRSTDIIEDNDLEEINPVRDTKQS